MTAGDGVTRDLAAQRAGNAAAAKRYRERKRAAERAGARVGRGYSWPPFEPGHEASVVHGAYGRRVDPLGGSIVADLLGSEDCPEHVRQPRFRWSLEAWGRTQAQIELLTGWIAGQVTAGGLEAALSESTDVTETTTHRKDGSRKVTAGRRVEAALVLLDRLERRAATLRAELGLSPAAAARMGLPLGEKRDSLLSQVLRLQLEDQRPDGGAA